LNIAGFFEPIISLLHNTVKEGFMKESNLKLLLVSSDSAELVNKMQEFTPPVLGTKWLELENSIN
jgi:predicted Rossmann-fold nucleotide-binding protein